MENRGVDNLPAFELPLDEDNDYRVGAGGDVDADNRDEIVVMRSNRILQYIDPENGSAAATRSWDVDSNGRSLVLANLDGLGYSVTR
jgi:hypothetical protein